MKPALYAHPFSSYCQKVLVALYENGTDFAFKMLSPDCQDNLAEFGSRWPVRRFPILVDDGRTIMEATAIIEHLQAHHPGPATMIPADADDAIEVRMLDRVFDNYVMTPMQKIVGDALRPTENRDGYGVAEARRLLDASYAWLDERMAGRDWVAGDFGLADCAAAPALFYADWAHPIPEALAHLKAYRARLLARPSFARAVDEARSYRRFFPLGAPDRD
ncbi:glutathione S-transferase family protein [Sphingomonas sp.]|uniref:glutathione S-transferase family protein n=1 Tax=Sphingomonas sp. TaxID=28214 RepID=UPI001B13D813|nr:glutathione S-transferase family protein [Sphingomonas sp.]MBO9712812.1 glutathione S-transferase family protein [Sphingomonas sp.]